MNVLEYIQKKGWEFKVEDSAKGKQIRIKICPFCRDKDWHFYVHSETGQYKCWAGTCNQAGGLFTLKKYMNDIQPVTCLSQTEKPALPEDINNQVGKAHEDIWESLHALHYLHERGWSKKTVEYFQLGVSKEDGVTWLWYPSFNGNMDVVNVKKRTLPPADKAFKRIEGGVSVLFNENALALGTPDIIVCEGEADCIAAHELGFPNVVGVPNGAGSIKGEWIAQLDKFERVYLAYDSDQAGQIGAQKLASRLGLERCHNITIPVPFKDVNEYLLSKGHEDFAKLVNTAERFNVENVKPIAHVIHEAMMRLTNSDEVVKLNLPWQNVNKLCGGFQAGDLITIGGRPGVGKTTFALNLLYHFATNEIPSLLFELEMRPERLLPRLIALHMHKDSSEIVSYEEYAEAYESFRDMQLYIAYKYERPNWDIVSDTIRICVRRYGIQFIVFDNLHFLCRNMNDQTREVSVMIQNFKLLAEELMLPIVVIARPTKAMTRKVIRGVDLKDSADIEGDSDIIILLHRERKDSIGEVEGAFDDKTLVIIDKARYSNAGATYLRAIDKEARFVEL